MRPDIDHLEALANAATPGEWESLSSYASGLHTVFHGDDGTDILIHRINEADGQFIAASRQAIPALIAYVRELEAAKAKALEQLEQWQLADDDMAEAFVERALKALRTP